MANLTFAVVVPPGDGTGAVTNISTSTRNKTVSVDGLFSGIIFIEGSCDGIAFNNVCRFDEEGIQALDDTILFVRIRRQYVADPSLIATCCVACPDSSIAAVTANQGAPGAVPWPVTVEPPSTALAGLAQQATLLDIRNEGGATGAAVPARAEQVGGRDGAGLLKAFAVDTNGFQYQRNQSSLAQAIYDGRITGVAGDFSGSVATAATTEVAVRATAYVEQATDAQRSFSSTSALDTNAAGTGARTIRLTYYSFVAGVMTGPFTEDIALAGLAAVNTVATNICFIEKIEVITRGAGATPPIGIVTMFAAAGGLGGAIASIAAGAYSTRYAHHYVASGRKCYVQGINVSSTAGSANQPRHNVRSFDFSVANASERRLMSDVSAQGGANLAQALMATPVETIGPARITDYVTPANAAAQSQFATLNFYEV